jgi:hypothetical protein
MRENTGVTGKDPSSPGGALKQLLIWVVVVAASYVGGYATRYVETRGLREELNDVERTSKSQVSQLQQQLQVSRLHGELGLLILEVEQSNFGKARQFSTRFFEDLLAVLRETREEASRPSLEAIRQRRDEITADLAQSNPEVGKKLRQIYGELVVSSGLKKE